MAAVKRKLVFFRYLLILVSMFWVGYFLSVLFYALTSAKTDDTTSTVDPTGKRKIILLWNSFWNEAGWEVGLGREGFERLGCPVKNCETTQNKSMARVSDALLFHIHDLAERPPDHWRSPRQRWVFFMLESPGYSKNPNYLKWNGLFNWTMTYRLDSDIRLHYGQVRPNASPTALPSLDWNAVLRRKERPVAWIVSNCVSQSKREVFVRRLSKFIPVDVYGRCGNHTCRKDWPKGDEACVKMVSDRYWFYLAFENSFCKDYVTEKFFKFLGHNIVPVVRGQAHYYKYAPGHWFINTSAYQSPRKLAEALKLLMKQPEKYVEHLQGKERYAFDAYFGLKHLPSWCELCRKLNNPSEPAKVYNNIGGWWSERDCQAPRDV